MIVFLSCVKLKRNSPCKARNMYISDLFQKSLAYAMQLNPRNIYILSAKYGLLGLDDYIEPYNQTLNEKMSAKGGHTKYVSNANQREFLMTRKLYFSAETTIENT